MASDEQIIEGLIQEALSSADAKEEEVKLQKSLNELKQEIEEQGFLQEEHRPTSSVTVPRDIPYLRRERHAVLKNALRVPEPFEIRTLADSTKEELQTVTKQPHDYSAKSLPLLLHDFFVDRSHELVQYKHSLLIRWKRFSEHTSSVESLFPQYQGMVDNIMAEYNDCLQRATRLASARESFLTGEDKGIMHVRLEDVIIYLRWLVSSLQANKTSSFYLRNIQWMHITHKEQLDFKVLLENKKNREKLNISHTDQSLTAIPPNAPSSLNPLLLNAQAIPPSHVAFATAAASGGGRTNLGIELPIHDTDINSLKPQLKLLAHSYGIEVDVDAIQNVGEEMALYAAVVRNFSGIFQRQERMKTLKTYDFSEPGFESWGVDHCSHAVRMEATWLPFVHIKPKKDAEYERKMADLRAKDTVDELLKVKSKFLHVQDPDRVQDTLRKHTKVLKDVREQSPLSFPRAEHPRSKEIWKRIYYDSVLRSEDGEMKKKGEYDYTETITMLGLEEASQGGTADDTSIANGGLLSLLHLRHLRIRDLQRSCLSILNMFRSIERTITINDGGLSVEGGKLKRTSPQKHREEHQLGAHQYIHNTPLDFKLDETAFMRFTDVENHDDYFVYQEGRVHVLDQRGYYIIYDVSMNDMKMLERDLLLMASSFLRSSKKVSFHVDRFGVLLDLWTSECRWLEAKKELVEVLFESYNHVFDPEERRQMAQKITDILYLRPRIDFEEEYFSESYKLECAIIKRKAELLRNVLDNHIEERRRFCELVKRDGFRFGLPQPIIHKVPVSIVSNTSALKSIHLLEFHPTLSLCYKVLNAIEHAVRVSKQAYQPKGTIERILVERRVLEIADNIFKELSGLGDAFSEQVQRDVFSDLVIGNPYLMTNIAETIYAEAEQQNSRTAGRDRQQAVMERVADVLLATHLWYQIVDTASQSQILSPTYRKMAKEMGYDECHLFLRFVQFELAGLKQNIAPPPVFITALLGDDSSVDRLVPSSIPLCINELDEAHLGQISMRSRDNVLNSIKSVDSIKAILSAQIVHKNMLACIVLQIDACEKDQSSFVSMQLEKAPSRNRMLNEFCQKKAQMGNLLRKRSEMEKLKRKLVLDFSEDFQKRVEQYALRSQLITCYQSMRCLLNSFPQVRDNYWVLGAPNEKKTSQDTMAGLQASPNVLTELPRRTLSEDGSFVLNIWFIPHYTEILLAYKTLDETACVNALRNHTLIASALHDILSYYCAHAGLGTIGDLNAKRRELVTSADWGGTEGIGEELRDINEQINRINKTDPNCVAKLLEEKRNVLILQMECAVRHSMPNTFLATNNVPAFKSINSTITALNDLSNIPKASITNIFTVPPDIHPRTESGRKFFPLRCFNSVNGPFSEAFYPWDSLQDGVYLAFSALKPVDRPVAHGEILGVSLLLEDVSLEPLPTTRAVNDEDGQGKQSRSASRLSLHERKASRPFSADSITGSLARQKPNDPLECLRRHKAFLLMWKRVEVLKLEWAKRKLSIEAIDTTHTYKSFCLEYRRSQLAPIISRLGPRQPNPTDDTNISLSAPKGVSEVLMKREQVKRLLSSLNKLMIEDTQKKITRDLQLVVAERQRGDNALPTDLWKMPGMAESYTAPRPHVAEDFAQMFYSSIEGDRDSSSLQIPRSKFENCLKKLATAVMAREKSNYDNYSSYYENVLRSQHHILYSKEREIKHLKSELGKRKALTEVDMQCALADRSHELLTEVTELRATIEQLQNSYQQGKKDGKEESRKDLLRLLKALHEATFESRVRFDEYRKSLYSVTIDKIRQVQEETSSKMDDKKRTLTANAQSPTPSGVDGTEEDSLFKGRHERMVENQLKQEKIEKERQEAKFRLEEEVKHLKEEVELTRKKLIKYKIGGEKTIASYKCHIDALREAVRIAEQKGDDERRGLERELKNKQHKLHAAEQKARNERRLHEARTANVDRLLEELDEKESRMKELTEQHEKLGRVTAIAAQSAKKKVDDMKKAVQRERALKMDAFQRVDELQCNKYEVDQRPLTTVGFSEAQWRRSASSPFNNKGNKVQRPKTTIGRLRTRLTDQLLNDIEPPDHHETIMKLKEIGQKRQQYSVEA
ncbi:DgyrCDS3568 [Dimorphilus gyrociliatus]|uniref:DgyrCDS3568 n=1 Tax=Dimorphilus gyrociliatus TaxID=2664684 RepID=A0A7I8VIQ0_9ANNE|nr:DgyrCDS3568 [Dimorphilus gyrociliatus]